MKRRQAAALESPELEFGKSVFIGQAPVSYDENYLVIKAPGTSLAALQNIYSEGGYEEIISLGRDIYGFTSEDWKEVLPMNATNFPVAITEILQIPAPMHTVKEMMFEGAINNPNAIIRIPDSVRTIEMFAFHNTIFGKVIILENVDVSLVVESNAFLNEVSDPSGDLEVGNREVSFGEVSFAVRGQITIPEDANTQHYNQQAFVASLNVNYLGDDSNAPWGAQALNGVPQS